MGHKGPDGIQAIQPWLEVRLWLAFHGKRRMNVQRNSNASCASISNLSCVTGRIVCKYTCKLSLKKIVHAVSLQDYNCLKRVKARKCFGFWVIRIKFLCLSWLLFLHVLINYYKLPPARTPLIGASAIDLRPAIPVNQKVHLVIRPPFPSDLSLPSAFLVLNLFYNYDISSTIYQTREIVKPEALYKHQFTVLIRSII